LFPSGLEGNDPRCVVSIIGCTDDWFGGWDGLVPGDVNNFITEDITSGRMVEVIESGEPAIIVCHWPGVYFNGEKTGFNILKEVKKRLDQKYDNLTWMKLSEISRYWAARELTAITLQKNNLLLKAPFTTPGFTIKLNVSLHNPRLNIRGEEKPFVRIKSLNEFKDGTFYSDRKESTLCFNLEKGVNELIL